MWHLIKPNKNKKAQVLLSDFVFSISIFIVIVSLLFYLQNTLYRDTEGSKGIKGFEDIADDIAYRFLFYEGKPKLWNISNVKKLGFSSGRDNIINYTKLQNLRLLSYDKSKHLLLSDLRYDFFVNISYLQNGSELFSYGKSPLDSSNLFKVERLGIINKSIVKVSIYVWK